mmetsp:Transcript_93291/g.273095  ORF Transcript_93291/g.273095 Transcript_93291/m.273095 type:complete len:456 (-) Transcript_93291:196-1563(-)
MAGGGLRWLTILAASVCPAVGLRLTDQPTVSARVTAQEKAAREADTCGKDKVPLDLARHEGRVQVDCDDLIPRYDMAWWVKQHGSAIPDHPAVFFNTGTHESEVFPSMEAFLALHGEETVLARPEYAQSGSHLKTDASGSVTASFRDLARIWNDTFVYFSDFMCSAGSLCDKASVQFGAPALFASKAFMSKNFLVGGPDSGLPFHKHGMTWQGLSMGRKAWYVMPPGSMSQELHDQTGPYIFPVRSYHGAMVGKKAGERPLYCVQHPGEVFYVPESWWHATMNLDRFQVAYGEKPTGKVQQWPRSGELSQMLQVLPQQSWDSAGFSPREAGGADSESNPMPYSLKIRSSIMQKTCGQGMDNATIGMEEPLRRMRAMAGSQIMTCGLAETAAFAHCIKARECERLSDKLDCALDADRQRDLSRDLRKRAQRWIQEATMLSPSLVRRETIACHDVCL